MDSTAGFRRIKCVCGKKIRVSSQISILSLQCPRCGKTVSPTGVSTARASGLSRGFFFALLTAVAAIGGVAVSTVHGCIKADIEKTARAKAEATRAEAADWLEEGIKANPKEAKRIEQKLTQAVNDVHVADDITLQQSLEDTRETIRERLSEIGDFTQTRQSLVNAKGILGKGNLEPASIQEIRRFLDSYLAADPGRHDPADAQEARKILAEIDVTTDAGRVKAALDVLDDAAFLDAARTPPMDGLPPMHQSLKDYHRKWVFPKVHGEVSAERDKRRRDEEQARNIKEQKEKQRKFAVRPDFTGEILGEDPFVHQIGEWTYMLTGGKRISVLRSTDLVVWEDRGELLKASKMLTDFPGSLSKPECIKVVDGFAVRCEATKPGRPTEQFVFTAYVKTLDPKEITPDNNLLRVQNNGGGRLDRSVTLNGKKWQFGVKATMHYGNTGLYSFKERTKHGHSLTCVTVTCDGKPRSNLYKSREDWGVQDLGTLVLAEYRKYTDLGGVHPFLDSNGQLFLAHHFSDTERGDRKTICIRPIVFAADGWPLAGEPLSSSRKWPNDGAALQTGAWTHICTYNLVSEKWGINVSSLLGTGGLSTQQVEADGTIGGSKTGATWRQQGDFLTLEFPKPASDKRMPDANYVDECVLGGQGTWYVGRNQFGELIRGISRGIR